MNQDDRIEWLTIAAHEMTDMPTAYFDEACAEARRTCDHPSKIVPAILGYKPSMYISKDFLHRKLREAQFKLENIGAKRLERKEVDEAEKHDVGAGMKDLVRELMAKAAQSEA
ncbi:MAG TPA: hypothetical protein VFI87_06365 [Hyphomicrobiaceae bacterium]|nr:hypothetical protein [Hyphomicrobiaceae bacterium]